MHAWIILCGPFAPHTRLWLIIIELLECNFVRLTNLNKFDFIHKLVLANVSTCVYSSVSAGLLGVNHRLIHNAVFIVLVLLECSLIRNHAGCDGAAQVFQHLLLLPDATAIVFTH